MRAIYFNAAMSLVTLVVTFAVVVALPDMLTTTFRPYVSGQQIGFAEILSIALLVLIVFVIPLTFYSGVVVSLVIVVAQATTFWAFGWTRFNAGFLVELAIEPLPFGTHSLTHIDWANGFLGMTGITHSWTYEHPIAIQRIEDWVATKLRY
jgi:hypothetical protein